MKIYYLTVPDASIAFNVRRNNINKSAYLAHKDWVQEDPYNRGSRYMTDIKVFDTVTKERKSLGLPRKKQL